MTRDHSFHIPSHDFSAGTGAESCSQQTHTEFLHVSLGLMS